MFKRVSIIAMSVSFIAAASASAKPGDLPFGRHNTPSILADKVEAKHKTDPTGNALLDPNGCASKERSCASTNNYIDMINQRSAAASSAVDPKTGGSINDPLAFARLLRTLELRDAPEGSYYSACIRQDEGGNYYAVKSCIARPFRKGEKAWVNPKTGDAYFFEDCANPIFQLKLLSPCVVIDIGVLPGHRYNIAQIGGDSAIVADACGPALEKPGETAYNMSPEDECNGTDCDFAGPGSYLKMKVWPKPRISFVAHRAGRAKLQLPASVLTSSLYISLCDTDMKTGVKTMGEVITQNSYVQNTAYVSYQASLAAPNSFKQLGGVEHVWTNSITHDPF